MTRRPENPGGGDPLAVAIDRAILITALVFALYIAGHFALAWARGLL